MSSARRENPATMSSVQLPMAVCEYNGKRQIEGMDGVYTARRVGVSIMELHSEACINMATGCGHLLLILNCGVESLTFPWCYAHLRNSEICLNFDQLNVLLVVERDVKLRRKLHCWRY